jgi:hypothetical protein
MFSSSAEVALDNERIDAITIKLSSIFLKIFMLGGF